MPHEAIKLNAVDKVLPLGHIPDALLQRLARAIAVQNSC
jgi:chemotaxis response regulator CheB